MAKRRAKKTTEGLGYDVPDAASSKPGARGPKSMVIRIDASEIGPSVTQLVRDVRTMMEPNTASRLKERRNNRLRDYTTMAGPLGVTHLLLFSRSEQGNVQLRLAISPRGPTFSFRVERYSLSKDIFKAMKRPRTGGRAFQTAPLLVMNNFSTAQKDDEPADTSKQVPKHLENLATTIFQSLFPPINPASTPLKTIKRVLLLDRRPQDPKSDSPTYILDVRHFAIESRPAKSTPKALRKLDTAQRASSDKRRRDRLPNLGRLEDVSDYLLDPHAADGFTSGSESEPETDAEVEILESQTRKVRNKAEQEKQKARGRIGEDTAGVQRRGIKLHELGPRMRLRLTKVEEGLCGGKVMWHEWIHKSKEEQANLERRHQERNAEKARRRAEQKANVERKKASRKGNSAASGEEPNGEDEALDDEDFDDDDWEEEDGDAMADD